MSAGSNPALERRRQRAESDFDEWAATVTERADPFMAWLGLVFALLVGYELAVDLSESASHAVEIAGWAIWGIFAFEFAIKLWLAPKRFRYVKRHWWQLAMLALPFLRLLRFLRLVRLGRALPASRVISSSYRMAGTARFLLRSRLAYLGGVASVGAIAVAELAYIFERDASDGAFGSFGDALLWAVTVVLAMQADPVPETAGGRIVMIGGFVVGLILVASLAGVIGAFLVQSHGDREERTPWQRHEEAA